MAYVDGDMLYQVTGTLLGGEVWANTWAFKDVQSDAEAQAVTDALHDLYEFFGTDLWTTNVNAVNCSRRDLFNGGNFGQTWATITGTTATDLLPTECALRLSIRSLPESARGGPFIAGAGVHVIDAGGLLETTIRDDVITALETFRDALGATATPAQLGLHRPTVTEVGFATSVRVGIVFDAIRARRNALPETYAIAQF